MAVCPFPSQMQQRVTRTGSVERHLPSESMLNIRVASRYYVPDQLSLPVADEKMR